jgi:hypothetical protein
MDVEGREEERNGNDIRDRRDVPLALFFADASCRAAGESLAIFRKRSVPLALSVDDDSFAVDEATARFALSILARFTASADCISSSLPERCSEPYDFESLGSEAPT